MKRVLITFAVLGALLMLLLAVLPRHPEERTPLADLKARYRTAEKSSANHSHYAALQQKFERPQDVTAACISCHTERHREVMASSHWNWERTEYIKGQGIRSVGKHNILNNYCIGISGNEQSCNKCHIGYGYAGPDFDFADANNVDCLACHDNSNTYIKANGGAGMPASSVDLAMVAQHVGKPTRNNCGSCHFYGGGGNNVKHGDLEEAMVEPDREIDVHMATDGVNLQCTACHTADKHQMLGKAYSLSSMNRGRVECASCHGDLPHRDGVLNQHTVKVACQTCHIPTYAKVAPTKLEWDWSTAGKLKDGKPYEVEDSSGAVVYASIKGNFVWGKNLQPEYVFFNGTASHYLIGDTFDPSVPLKINELHGDYNDPDAKIYPVKVHRANQIFDTEHKYLIQPKTVSNTDGDGGYWKEFNWQRAAEEGMKRIDLPYSGKYNFARTEMYWPVNHMVSPASKSVTCSECHTREGGRLAGLRGFYMPGRDSSPLVETAGIGIVLATLGGVFVHGAARVVISRRRKGKH